MRTLSWLLLSSFLGTALGKVPLSSVKRVSNLPTVPNKFIVELDTLSRISNKRSLSPHQDLYDSLKKRAITFEVYKEYSSQDVFVGVALTLNDSKDVADLQSVQGVKAIRPVRKLQRPSPAKVHTVTGPNDPALPPDSQSTHILTGVDKLHAAGITGKGIKIGIIDTGIDYTHPALGGGFGPGHKVAGGFDLVGDNYDGNNPPVPDSDPLDQCEGHGTHVAGIIGANPNNEYNISGVAYEATLTSYRVFGCVGSTSDDVIIDALLLGVKDGQDILSLSLGGPDGWTESSAAVVASRIAASGKIVTISAGNDGSSGSWYTSGPSTGIDVISVSSLDNTYIPIQYATVGGVDHPPILYFQFLPFPFKSALPIFATSNDTTVADDACNPLPDSTPDLSPYLVVVRRGSCSFVQKAENIAARGAKVVFFYNNGGSFAGISVGNFSAALIQAADGEFLVKQFAAGAPTTISFPQTGASTQFPDPNGGLISSFTSYGPSNDFFFKPSVAAPGGNILSTVPVPLGSFAILSGTSMAAPFMAGSAALLLSVKGKSPQVAKSARTLFETTAQKVPSSHTDGDPLQTVTQQGAGLINVPNAIYAETIVSPGELILNDTAHFKDWQTFTVKNTGNKPKRYTLKHVPAGTAVTVRPGTIFPSNGPVPLTKATASVFFVQDRFTVYPGTTHTVLARFSLPKGDATSFPVFSGFIEIASGSETHHVTYLGLGASLKDKQVIDNTDFYFDIRLPAILDSNGNAQQNPTNYTFAGGDFPTLLFRLVFGTPALRFDLVNPDIKLEGTLNPRDGLLGGPFFTFPHPHKGGSFAKVKVVGPLSENDFVGRHNEAGDTAYSTVPFVQPVFANGTRIPNGTYRVLVRALRVTGNPTKQEDYDSWLSPIVGITA